MCLAGRVKHYPRGQVIKNLPLIRSPHRQNICNINGRKRQAVRWADAEIAINELSLSALQLYSSEAVESCMSSQDSSLHSIVLMAPQPHSSANSDRGFCSVYAHRPSRMEH